MSGEATSKTSASAEAFERAFGSVAACNRCQSRIEDYRVVAVFLHDTAAVRAYCRACYPAASEADYFAGGERVFLQVIQDAQRDIPLIASGNRGLIEVQNGHEISALFVFVAFREALRVARIGAVNHDFLCGRAKTVRFFAFLQSLG